MGVRVLFVGAPMFLDMSDLAAAAQLRHRWLMV